LPYLEACCEDTFDPKLSPLDRLGYRFCETLKSDLLGGGTLASFGKFMIEVPRRIGLQKLYDLSVESVRPYWTLIEGWEIFSLFRCSTVCVEEKQSRLSSSTDYHLLAHTKPVRNFPVPWILGLNRHSSSSDTL